MQPLPRPIPMPCRSRSTGPRTCTARFLAAALAPALLAGLAASLATGLAAQQANPILSRTPWAFAQDNDTVTVVWSFDNPNFTTPSFALGPTWFDPQATKLTASSGFQWNATGQFFNSGTLRTASNVPDSELLEFTIDNDPRTDFVKIYEGYSLARGVEVQVNAEVEELLSIYLRHNVQIFAEQIGSDTLLIVQGELYDQPGEEKFEVRVGEAINGIASLYEVDEFVFVTRCVPIRYMEDSEAIGSVLSPAKPVPSAPSPGLGQGITIAGVGEQPNGPPGTVWVSISGATNGSPHLLQEIDLNGVALRSVPQPTVRSLTNPTGMRDLTTAPLPSTGTEGIYGIDRNATGGFILRAFNPALGVFSPADDVVLPAFPAATEPTAVAFNRDGNWRVRLASPGAPVGSFYIATGAGNVLEVAYNGQVLRTAGPFLALQQTTGAGYDWITGEIFWFGRRPSAGDSRGVQVVGRVMDARSLRFTGTVWNGDPSVIDPLNPSLPGGLALGLEVYRQPDGKIRILQLAEGQGARWSILGGQWEFGRGTKGRPTMNGFPPILGSSFQLSLTEAAGSQAGLLYLGVSNSTYLGAPLPLAFPTIGFLNPEANLLISLDTQALPVPSAIDASGTVTVPGNIVIPNLPNIRGLTAYAQWLVLDNGFAAGSNLGTSVGVQTVIY